MKKIKSFADARNLLKHLAETGESLVLWDLPHTCVIIGIIKCDDGVYTVYEHEDVRITEDVVYRRTELEMLRMLWFNRKTICAAEYNIKTVFC